MARNIEHNLEYVRRNPLSAISPHEYVELSRAVDIMGASVALVGSFFGDVNTLIAGMSIYQANTGNRA